MSLELFNFHYHVIKNNIDKIKKKVIKKSHILLGVGPTISELLEQVRVSCGVIGSQLHFEFWIVDCKFMNYNQNM